MDWFTFWEWVEIASDIFYDPVVFWALPLALACLYELIKQWRDRKSRA